MISDWDYTYTAAIIITLPYLEYSISNMRMRSINLVQGSKRVRRCTNQDGTFPRRAALVLVFAGYFCSREARVHSCFCLLLYMTWWGGYDYYRPLDEFCGLGYSRGNVSVLPAPQSAALSSQECPLSTILSTHHWLVYLSLLRILHLLSLSSRRARRVVHPLATVIGKRLVTSILSWHGGLLLVINSWLRLVLLALFWA